MSDFAVGSHVFDNYADALDAFADGLGAHVRRIDPDGSVHPILGEGADAIRTMLARVPFSWPHGWRPGFLSPRTWEEGLDNENVPTMRYHFSTYTPFSPKLLLVREDDVGVGLVSMKLGGVLEYVRGPIPVEMFSSRGPFLPMEMPERVEVGVPLILTFRRGNRGTSAAVDPVLWGAFPPVIP